MPPPPVNAPRERSHPPTPFKTFRRYERISPTHEPPTIPAGPKQPQRATASPVHRATPQNPLPRARRWRPAGADPNAMVARTRKRLPTRQGTGHETPAGRRHRPCRSSPGKDITLPDSLTEQVKADLVALLLLTQAASSTSDPSNSSPPASSEEPQTPPAELLTDPAQKTPALSPPPPTCPSEQPGSASRRHGPADRGGTGGDGASTWLAAGVPGRGFYHDGVLVMVVTPTRWSRPIAASLGVAVDQGAQARDSHHFHRLRDPGLSHLGLVQRC